MDKVFTCCAVFNEWERRGIGSFRLTAVSLKNFITSFLLVTFKINFLRIFDMKMDRYESLLCIESKQFQVSTL